VPELSALTYMPRLRSDGDRRRGARSRVGPWTDARSNLAADQLSRRVKRLMSRWITEAVPADNTRLKKRIWAED